LSHTFLIPDAKQQKVKSEKYPADSELAARCEELEKAFMKANQRLYLILEGIQDGFIIVDHDWALNYVNKSAAKGFGVEAKNLVGKNIWELFPNYIGTIFEKSLRSAKADMKVERFEWDKLYSTLNTWEISVFPTSGDLVIIWRDIAQRKKIEETLRLDVERFSKAFNCCQTALFMSRLADGFFLDANEAFLLMFGFSRDEVVGNTVVGLNIYPDLSRRKEFVRMLQAQGAIHNLEVTMQTKTGMPLTLIVSVERIILNGQDVTLGTFTDITERKKEEDMHRESEEHLKVTQRLVHMGNWAFHVMENKIFWSDGLFHIFKLKPAKLGLNYEGYKKYIHPNDFEWVTKRTDRFISEGKLDESAVFDYRVILADGSVHDLHTEQIIVEVNAEGKPAKIMGIEQDITERKKIEHQLELHRRQLEQLVEERTIQLADSERLVAIGQTAGMVGHDIRNPLQAIMSSLYLIKNDLDTMGESEEKIDALQELSGIGEQVSYIDKIIADLQDYARPIKPKYAEVDMSELIDSIFQTVNLPSGVMLEVHIDNLPKMITDATLMRRVLTNLVNNAVQAMADGGTLTIHSHQDKKTDGIIIEVKDTGKGIPKEVQEKIFTPLFTTKSKGQGFGLAVVKRITDALDGKIEFVSQEGMGTKFRLDFQQKKCAKTGGYG
jgi:PAS domain S-box-containing protein